MTKRRLLLLLEGRTGETAAADSTRIWAGRIADSFYIDLSLLSIVNAAVAKGTPVDLSGWRPKSPRTASRARHPADFTPPAPHRAAALGVNPEKPFDAVEGRGVGFSCHPRSLIRSSLRGGSSGCSPP